MVKRMARISVACLFAVLLIVIAGCAGNKRKVQIQPGEQLSEAEVDVKNGSVTSEKEGVVVRVQAAIIPAPGGDDPHPSFWVTIKNNRRDKIVIKPASTRLIDTFGNQLKPMSVNEGGDRLYPYVNVDPQVHFFFSVNHGWPYYPFYPYRSWFYRRPYRRFGYYPYHDPFWNWGFHSYYHPYWVRRVPMVRRTSSRLESEETVYQGAKMTYAVLFPQLGEMVREVRLIVPDVTLYDDGQTGRQIDFELIFDQIVEVKEE